MPLDDELIPFPRRTPIIAVVEIPRAKNRLKKFVQYASRFANVIVVDSGDDPAARYCDIAFYITNNLSQDRSLLPRRVDAKRSFVLGNFSQRGLVVDPDSTMIDVEGWDFTTIAGPNSAISRALIPDGLPIQNEKRLWYYDELVRTPIAPARTIKYGTLMDSLARPVDSLDLSVRSARCLESDGINYIGDLVKTSEAHLLRVPNFGRKSLREIIGVLAAEGLFLNMDIPYWPPADLVKRAETAETRLLVASIDQQSRGIRFVPGPKTIEFRLDENLGDEVAANETLTKQLHEEIIRKLNRFAEVARRLDNQLGWQGIHGSVADFLSTIDCDIAEIPAKIGLVYSRALEIGSFLEQANHARSDPEHSVEPLNPEAFRMLDDVVRTSAPWVRRFPTARELDEEAGEFLANIVDVKPAISTLALAISTKLLDRQTGHLVQSLLEAESRGSGVSKKAASRGLFSTKNIAICAIGILSATGSLVAGAVASDIASKSELVHRAGDFLISAEKPVLELLKDLPSDIRTAVESFIRDLSP